MRRHDILHPAFQKIVLSALIFAQDVSDIGVLGQGVDGVQVFVHGKESHPVKVPDGLTVGKQPIALIQQIHVKEVFPVVDSLLFERLLSQQLLRDGKAATYWASCRF